MAIEIVSFPIQNMVDLSIALGQFTRPGNGYNNGCNNGYFMITISPYSMEYTHSSWIIPIYQAGSAAIFAIKNLWASFVRASRMASPWLTFPDGLAPGPSAKKDIHSETANFCCRRSQITSASGLTVFRENVIYL